MQREDYLHAAVHRFDELTAHLQDPQLAANPERLAALMREYKQLEPLAGLWRDICRTRENLAELELLSADTEMRALAAEEMEDEQQRLNELNEQLEALLLADSGEGPNEAIVEIRSGAGGEEAALFAHSLHRMYSMYAERQGWQQTVMNCSETELGGVKEIIFLLSGAGVWSKMRFESGVHRVQRVPETESQGRIHTSTVTVAVLQTVEEVEFELNPADLRIDTFRSSGAGGQHINKTSSAIRVTHIPTGTVVECQNERSQFQNKERALAVLRARLHAQAQAEQDAAVAQTRRNQVGSGDRSEKIRTYNFPQSRLTDHRIGFSLYRLDDVMNGELDPVFDALTAAEQAERMSGKGENS